jgi:cytochrome c oxidase cbb3-type subunit 4
MDINDLRSIFTVLVFVIFIGIVWWAYSGQRKHSFEQAAKLALEDDDLPASGRQNAGQRDN